MKKDVKTLSADDILSIPVGQPERLFTGESATMKMEWKLLRSKWHTDHSGRDDVFQHIKEMYDAAVDKLGTGVWEIPGEFHFTAIDGSACIMQHVRKRAFELGDCYIGPSEVLYHVKKPNLDLLMNAMRTTAALTYNTEIEKKIKEFMPSVPVKGAVMYETADSFVYRVGRPKNSICLHDLLEQQGGKIDPKHVAWIISRLYNLACYLHLNKVTHNDFSLDSLYVTPDDHNVSLIGGWWYARPFGSKLLAASSNTVRLIPMSILGKKMADPVIDLNLIRGVGRTLLGDVVGNLLVRDKTIPKPLVTWLLGASSGDARKDYKVWQEKVLPESFGVRKFVKFDVAFNDVYCK